MKSFTAGKVVISLVADVENMMLLTFVKAHTTKSPVTALFVCLELKKSLLYIDKNIFSHMIVKLLSVQH